MRIIGIRMTNVKAQMPNECQMTNAKKKPPSVTQIKDSTGVDS